MLRLLHSIIFLVALASQVFAWSEEWKVEYEDFEVGVRGHQKVPGKGEIMSVMASNSTGSGYFKQLIDHKDPGKGTFDQFYYWSSEFWKGPGSPVVLFTPGEVNGSLYTSYLTGNRLSGTLAKEMGAAIFVVEHRYWGNSSPFPELTTANLQYLTLENSILDFTYFAKNIQAPWAPNVSTTADKVPWVATGGSYSGALSAWTESVAPGTFWAYHSSSAPVQAISDYAGYFYPVQQGMAKNCSADINRVINYMDAIIASGNKAKIAELKTMFKMQDVKNNDDFMAALENGPWLWQGNQLYTGYSPFFRFCDYIENARSTNGSTSTPSAYGVGLAKALKGYADWFTNDFLPDYCYDTYGYPEFNGTFNTKCFDTYNKTSPLFTDTSLSNTIDRQWQWMLCNEPFGYWQDGAPLGRQTLVSRFVNPKYWIRQCELFFPRGPKGETYGLAKGKTEADTNRYTKGWNTRPSTRLIYANGQYDPWRESGVSADIRPGGPLQSTAQTPVNIVPGGFHCSDMITKNGVVNAGAKQVMDAQVKQIVEWVGQWGKHNSRAIRWAA